EADLPAQQSQARPYPWLSGPHGHRRRAQGAQGTPCQGTQAPDPLIRPIMAGAGLPRRARLRRAADFAALRRAEGRVRGTFFLLRYGPSEGPTARLGLAVSRKVSPRAVERNRIKRQIRESFRRHRPDLPNVD